MNSLDGFKCVVYVSYFHTCISTATYRISSSKPSYLRSRFPSASVHRGGEANRNLYCSSQVVASWLAPRCLWTQMNWARHSCPRVSTIKVETSVLPQVFPSLYTCWEPSSTSNKSGSVNCHCLSRRASIFDPNPKGSVFLYSWSCHHLHRRRMWKQGWGGFCITSQIRIQI